VRKLKSFLSHVHLLLRRSRDLLFLLLLCLLVILYKGLKFIGEFFRLLNNFGFNGSSNSRLFRMFFDDLGLIVVGLDLFLLVLENDLVSLALFKVSHEWKLALRNKIRDSYLRVLRSKKKGSSGG
jgi:hypothetical protein